MVYGSQPFAVAKERSWGMLAGVGSMDLAL